MSLRARVIGLIGLVLLVSVAVYLIIAWTGARDDLAAELGAARTGGLQTVRSAFEDLPRSDHPDRDLRQLVATFNGNRHLKAALLDAVGHRVYASRAALPRAPAPHWFATLVDPGLESTGIAVPGRRGALLILAPEPASDIAAHWSASVAAAELFLIATGIGLALTYFVIGRALAPLANLSAGLARIGGGAYQERVAEKGAPELLTLQRGFNTMAQCLADIDARNRTLENQLLTIQDEERAEIARDLHDEIGPHLFAVALDAEMIGRSVAEGATQTVSEQVRSIKSAVSYMQREVRDLIARLRPTRAAELGLEAALGDLVSFWQLRQPKVVFVKVLEAADGFVPVALRDVIYRIAQEALANALRHAETTRLSLSVLPAAGGVTVVVANEGSAKDPARDKPGLGLTSMRERVQAAGGTLSIDRAHQGWTVTACFGVSPDEKATA